MLLQGSALGSMEYKEPLHEIWGKNGGGALTQFLDRWHPVDPKADPYDPSTVWTSGHYAYTGRWAKNNSAFNRVSTAYLRLKTEADSQCQPACLCQCLQPVDFHWREVR